MEGSNNMAIIGIDLGTTNSLAVAFQQDEVVMIPNVYGDYLTPSVVSVDDDGQIIVGKSAKQRLITHPEDTTSLFKRNMGTKEKVKLKNIEYLPEELSAFIVKQLISDAKTFLQEEISEVVISVPAYFDNEQRSSTKRVGDILGVKVERLINEPSAASIACHYGNEEDEAFVVFDFGGGTLDVSVVDCFDNVVSICSIAGNNKLGGSDFDKEVALDFCREHNLSFEQLEKKYQESLLFNCENAKIALQNQNETTIEMYLNEKHYTYTLTNTKLEILGTQLFNKMKAVIAEAVNSSGFDKDEIDKIVMVGGSCHMPIVSNFLIKLMKVDVYENVDKDYMVARGLGIYVGIKQRSTSIKNLVLTDICPFSLSNAVRNKNNIARDLSSVIIPKNSVLPAVKTKPFQTIEKAQKEVIVSIYQGEGIYADQNKLLADHTIMLPNNGKIEEFDITFIYDINSILCAEVRLHSTGQIHTFGVGDTYVSTESIDSIKNASLKLTLEPELEYINEQVARIMEESSIQTQEWVRERFLEFTGLMNQYQNNLRKRAVLMKRMQEIIDNLKEEMNHNEFFNVEGEDKEPGGYLS